MNLTRVLQYFIPKEKKFYALFNLVAENIVEGATEFEKLVNSPSAEERRAIGLKIKSIEKKGDKYTYDLFDELNHTFITPIDREDIHSLTSAMDDVLDLIHGASEKIEYYRCNIFSLNMKEMASYFLKGCREMQSAINELETFRNSDRTMRACRNINEIESMVDRHYHLAISDLFDTEKDAIELIRQKEILLNIEKAVNKLEDVSDLIETILVKYN